MAESTGASRPDGPVHRAFGLLQLVVMAAEPVGVRELARRSGLSKSTVGRMLGILTELGMVERTSDGSATAGAGLMSLTASVADSIPVLRERVRPLTEDLVREFGENAAVCIDDGSALLYVDSNRLDTAVQVADPVGERFEFHLVAPGLVAMASWTNERLTTYLSEPLSASTEHSVTTPKQIIARLSEVRRLGFAWTDQELDLDVNGVAVPIRSTGGALAAIATLYGPSYRLNADASPDLGAAMASFVARRSSPLFD
ncbi:MAG: IclR family transcriptional regulator [Ilumatobacteraceae bacterium]